MTKHSVTITFPNEEMLDIFRGWMSDGGGEYNLMEIFEDCSCYPEGKFVSFDYSSDSMIHCTFQDEDGILGDGRYGTN